ncbi:MAG: PTS sugar transporter subunit IIB [Anaerolineaceae bacterium]
MNILLVCAGGISTSFFVQNIRREYESQKIDGVVMAKSITEVPEFINNIDIIFIAPQAVFFKEKVEKICSQRSIPCQVIDTVTYGQMDGKKIIELAKKSLGKGG